MGGALLVLVAAMLGVGGCAPAAAQQVETVPVRIMPLGASITWGHGSSSDDGYRRILRERLSEAGVAVDLVGSQRSGSMTDAEHEGHPGYRIDQVAGGVSQWLADARPDVVLINVGTNDTIQNRDLADAPDRLRRLIDSIVAVRPGALVVFSSLVPSGDLECEKRVRAFNAALPSIAQAQREAGHRVVLVDLHGALTVTDIGPDRIHPTDAGYRRIADAWFAALQPQLAP